MSSYTIKDLEQISGIKAHTIRIWEQRYNFLQPKRTETNIRTYSSGELKTILNVALLNKYGYKISHIDKMSADQMEDKVLGLTQLDAQREKVVNELIKSMVSLDMHSFERLLDLYIAQKGIEKTINEVVFSFLERVGILWVTNHINPAQEHLSTNLLRQKIILGIEKLPAINFSSKRVVLFMPEGEYHELGLLYIHFLLKQRGIGVDYLGANVPIVDLKYITSFKKVDYLFCHITSPAKNFKLTRFIEQLASIPSEIPIVLSGQVIQDFTGQVSPQLHLKRTLAETIQLIDTL